jgi:hypothetical protein
VLTRRRRFAEFVEAVKGGVAVLGLGMFLAGLVIAGYQSFVWLRNGRWPRCSVVEFVRLVARQNFSPKWLERPDSWFGLHELATSTLKAAPASLLFMTIGGFVFAVFITIMDSKRFK